LLDANCRKPNLRHRVEESIENAVCDYALKQPAHGQVRVSNELRRRGIFVSASGVRAIWLRHDLSSFRQRLRALEKQVADKAVGWLMRPHMKAELVTDALRMAQLRRRPKAGVIVHSDRGSQYCSGLLQDMLKAYDMRSSMSRRGDC